MSSTASITCGIMIIYYQHQVVSPSLILITNGSIQLAKMMTHQDSWADQQGIIPGSELIELDGTEACLDKYHHIQETRESSWGHKRALKH